MNYKRSSKEKRLTKIRKKIRENTDRPRLSVFRSNQHISAQIIDDKQGITLVAASDQELGKLSTKKGKKTKKTDKKTISTSQLSKKTKAEKASLVGAILAQKAKDKKITKVVFDRGAYKYHGRVKALADAARKQGLQF